MQHLVDISSHQTGFDFDAYATEHQAVIIKQTEGLTYPEDRPTHAAELRRMRDEAHRVGLRAVGLYHWLRVVDGRTGEDEADHFASFVGPLRLGEFVCIDDEDNESKAGQEHEDFVLAFVDRLLVHYPELGRSWSLGADTYPTQILYYSYPAYLARIPTGRVVNRCALWIARYGNNDGTKQGPPPLDRWPAYALWQWTSQGRVPGWGGDIDLNEFPGTAEELDSLGGRVATVPETPEPTDVVVITELRSPNGRHRLLMQDDGNAALYADGKARWSSETFGRGADLVWTGHVLAVRDASGNAVWVSPALDASGGTLALQDDGNLVTYRSAMRATAADGSALDIWHRWVWASQTADAQVQPPPAPEPPEPPPEAHPEPAHQIEEWGFEDVEAFQSSFAHRDLVIDGDAGPETAAAVQEVIDQGGRLSQYFAFGELRSKGNGRIRSHRSLLRRLDEVRLRKGPFTPISAYRDPRHNAAVGGATNSQHMLGTAVDISEHLGLTVDEATAIGFSGVGYVEGTDRVVHVDVRAEGPNNTTGAAVGRPTLWTYPR